MHRLIVLQYLRIVMRGDEVKSREGCEFPQSECLVHSKVGAGVGLGVVGAVGVAVVGSVVATWARAMDSRSNSNTKIHIDAVCFSIIDRPGGPPVVIPIPGRIDTVAIINNKKNRPHNTCLSAHH